MSDFVLYLVKMTACSGIFFLFYLVALRNKNNHGWNRLFLLSSVFISILVPFLHFTILNSASEIPQKPIQLLKVVQSANDYLDEISVTGNEHIHVNQLVLWSYVFISFVLLVLLLKSISKILSLIAGNHKQSLENIYLIYSNSPGTPFTFFHYIFWNDAIDLNSHTGQMILIHESVHAREKHSLDKLYIQFVLVFLWINPFFWIIRKELNLIHEFIADKKSVGDHGASAFAAMILQTAYPDKFNKITSHFFQSSIKRRIQMLTKIHHSKLSYVMRLLSFGIVACTVFAFTVSTRAGKSSVILEKDITVIIDAGHGKINGSFSGARHEDVYEDKIVLSLANKIKSLNQNQHVKILLSRSSDESVALKERVEFARNKKADLFISLHVAATDPNQSANNKRTRGFEIFVPKEQPLYEKKSEFFGSILQQELNNSYYTYPELLKPNVGIWVLNKNVCTSVLIECGYITDATDRDFITNEKNQNLVAEKILTSIERFAREAESK